MGATRLQLEILTHTIYFAKRFEVYCCTDVYICYQLTARYTFAQVNVYRTSAHCYRVMYFSLYANKSKKSGYISFRTIGDMCAWFDTVLIKTII